MAPEFPCTRFTPGHQVHFIQVKLSNAGEWRPVELVSRDGFEAIVAVDDGVETWRFHAAETTRRLLAAWRPAAPAFLSDRNLVSVAGGFVFPCRNPAWWVDCGETTQPRR